MASRQRSNLQQKMRRSSYYSNMTYRNKAFLLLVLMVGSTSNTVVHVAAKKAPHFSNRKMKEPCILVDIHVQYENETKSLEEEEDSWDCELQGQDVEETGIYFTSLKGISRAELQANPQVTSGKTRFFSEDAIFASNGEMRVPPGAQKKFERMEDGTHPSQQRNKKERAEKREQPKQPRADNKEKKVSRNKDDEDDPNQDDPISRHLRTRQLMPEVTPQQVLVVRVKKSKDHSVTTPTKEELEASAFGAGGEQLINLQERFDSCSFGQKTIQPYRGSTPSGLSIDGGVAEVEIDVDVMGETREAVTNAMLAALGFQKIQDEVDYVLMCLPKGVLLNGKTSWIGGGPLNSYITYYNDDWCTSTSAQMHEIGHNMGLSHSGGTFANGVDSPYADGTCMMGASGKHVGTRNCYNPAKSYELGWYASRTETVNILRSESRVVLQRDLTCVDYFDRQGPEEVHLKIMGGASADDLYIGFNCKMGITAGSKGADNKVTVTRAGPGNGPSWRVEDLDEARESYIPPDFAQNGAELKLSVTSIRYDAHDQPVSASIEVTYEPGRSRPLPQTQAPSPSPTTPPTLYPTRQPTSKPTQTPTQRPTLSPSPGPTLSPTQAPTENPTAKPSQIPEVPEEPLPATRAPSPLPTTVPTRNPTRQPTSKPTQTLTQRPSTLSPSPGPTRSPTQAPTENPPTKSSQMPIIQEELEDPQVSATARPTVAPIANPAALPTIAPVASSSTQAPVAIAATASPTWQEPVPSPTPDPTVAPVPSPTKKSTTMPTTSPTTKAPTFSPTESTRPPVSPSPTKSPTLTPTTSKPTPSPAEEPLLSAPPQQGDAIDGIVGDTVTTPLSPLLPAIPQQVQCELFLSKRRCKSIDECRWSGRRKDGICVHFTSTLLGGDDDEEEEGDTYLEEPEESTEEDQGISCSRMTSAAACKKPCKWNGKTKICSHTTRR